MQSFRLSALISALIGLSLVTAACTSIAPTSVVSLSPNAPLDPDAAWREDLVRVESCQSTWFYILTDGEIAYYKLFARLPPSSHEHRLAYVTTDTRTFYAIFYTRVCLVLEAHYILYPGSRSIAADHTRTPSTPQLPQRARIASPSRTTDSAQQKPQQQQTERRDPPAQDIPQKKPEPPTSTVTPVDTPERSARRSVEPPTPAVTPVDSPARATSRDVSEPAAAATATSPNAARSATSSPQTMDAPDGALFFGTSVEASRSLRVLATWKERDVTIQMKEPGTPRIEGRVMLVDGVKLYIYNKKKLRQVIQLTQVAWIALSEPQESGSP